MKEPYQMSAKEIKDEIRNHRPTGKRFADLANYARWRGKYKSWIVKPMEDSQKSNQSFLDKVLGVK